MAALWKFFSRKKKEEKKEENIDKAAIKEAAIEEGRETGNEETVEGPIDELTIDKVQIAEQEFEIAQDSNSTIHNPEKITEEMENRETVTEEAAIEKAEIEEIAIEETTTEENAIEEAPVEKAEIGETATEGAVVEEVVAEKTDKKGWFKRLKDGLSKTRDNFTYKIRKVLNFSQIDEDVLEELEELFIQGDIGTDLTIELIEKIDRLYTMGELKNSDDVIAFLKKEFLNILESKDKSENITGKGPLVTLIVGVNGAGKTTTIGKLASHLKTNGKKVLMVAGDTFRAAIEQLEIWAGRTGSAIIKHNEGADSAAVVFDGVNAGISRNVDCILVDTAGRLHNKVNLMNELEKVKKVIKKADPEIEIETLLVIDSTSGQNGLIQAKTFKKVVDIDGIILTKMDGTAKGGIILPIVKELNVNVNFIGVGEQVDDLRYFDAKEFVDALFD